MASNRSSAVIPFPNAGRPSLPPLPAVGLVQARTEPLPDVSADWQARSIEQALLTAARSAHWALCVALRDLEMGDGEPSVPRPSLTTLHEAARQADGALQEFYRVRAAALASRVSTLAARCEAAEALAEGGRIAERLANDEPEVLQLQLHALSTSRTTRGVEPAGIMEKALLTRFRALDPVARLELLRMATRLVPRATPDSDVIP